MQENLQLFENQAICIAWSDDEEKLINENK